MKRSEINTAIQEASRFFASLQFMLPAWASYSPAEWETVGESGREIYENGLGWDITDFGLGKFARKGLTLLTLRNGSLRGGNKTYCEKIMMVREGQVTPAHFHWRKTEDIINRGGGDLLLQVWKATTTEDLCMHPLLLSLDGIQKNYPAGAVIRLKPGESVTFEPLTYHAFWSENGDCMVGEVSTLNDDSTDNRFFDPVGRFPTIEEDTAATVLLYNEYPFLQQSALPVQSS